MIKTIGHIFSQLPQGVYWVVLSIFFGCVFISIGKNTLTLVDRSGPREIQGTYQVTLGSVGSILGEVTGSTFGSGRYVLTLSGSGTFHDDLFSFEDIQIIKDGPELSFYYGPIIYTSSSQTGASQLIHQYLWLGDRYENKRYTFKNFESYEHRLSAFLSNFFILSTTQDLGVFSSTETLTFSLKNVAIQATGHIDYSMTKLNTTIINKPLKSVDGSVFIEAFLGSGFVENNFPKTTP